MIRLATTDDIELLHAIRLNVRENALTNHARVQLQDYRSMLEVCGRGWVFESEGKVVGFGIADHDHRNIWALFVLPDFQHLGVGRGLLREMVNWLFAQGSEPIWLTTEPHTRAEGFYRAAGWQEVGTTSTGEMRFELSAPTKDGSS